MSPAGSLVVFAKAPRPGEVKTRLCPPFTPEQAAALYSAMLADVLEASAADATRLGLAPVLAVHPPEAREELAARAPEGFTTLAQRGPGLGARMEAAAADAAARTPGPILLRGSDSPALAFESVAAVAAALAEADLAVAPAADGGYDLVGLARPVAGVFSHPMSTGSVLDDSVAAARRLGLRARVLGPELGSFDLDTAADLARLAALRASGRTLRCENTFAYMDRSSLWDLASA